MRLLLDILLGFVIWFGISIILIVAFPGEANPDGSNSNSWLILVGVAVAVAIVVYRRHLRLKSKRKKQESNKSSAPPKHLNSYVTQTSVEVDEPHGSTSETRHTQPAKVERARQSVGKGEAVWVLPGESVTVQGRLLPDGMVYVGSSLRGVSQHVHTDPALIDTVLRVDDCSSDTDGDDMGYWPSYSEITPASRAAYLDWLSAGRPAGVHIGYVFLFFYGIERRVLFDIDRSEVASAEAEALIAEVERLLDLYRDSNSFKGYASNFLSLFNCLRRNLDPAAIEPPLVRGGWDLPLELKLGLGSIVSSGEPLPALWALSWLRLHPETTLRTPAVRCANEFDALFRVRYHEIHGAGMKIRRNKTQLRHSYQPASASFQTHVELTVDGLPDVSRLKAPVRRLQELAESVTDELNAFSRWVGRHGDRESLAAVALLPGALVAERQSAELRDLRGRIATSLSENNTATIPVPELVAGFPSQRPSVFSAKEATTFAQLLERLGFGITPDIRYSNVNLTKHQHAAVFRLVDEHSPPSERYQAATVLLHLGAAVSAADGTVTADEERRLETQLEESLDLAPTDRTRLRAHLQWLLIEPPTLNRMKSRIRALSESDLKLVARFAVTIAGADGSVSSDEVKVLNRVYGLIGLETEQLHRDIHELASAPPTQPVTVMRPDEQAGYQVPPQPATYILDADRVELDRERIAEVMKATREVSDLLTEIFEGPAVPDLPETDIAVAVPDDESSISEGIGGGLLDPAHAELVRFLATRPNWTRSAFEELARNLALMPGGAIETINDASFARCDEPLVEGDDLLEVNEFALKELLDAS